MSELAKVTRTAPRGMISLRGDLASAPIKKAVKSVIGCIIPDVGKIASDGASVVGWMSPDELLLMVPYDDVQNRIAALNGALAKHHVLIADVSDARAIFRIVGPSAAQVLARLCPVDVHEVSFKVGDLRRTRLAQVAAAFWRDDAGFEVICFRSVGDYVEALLQRTAAAAPVDALRH